MRKRNAWTDDKVGMLRALCNEGVTDSDIAIALTKTFDNNFSYDSVERARRRYAIKKPIVQQEDVKDKNLSLRRGFDNVCGELKSQLETVKACKPIKVPTSKGDTLMIQFTDWHIGKEIKNETGEVIFNALIARERVHVLIGQILSLLDNHVSKGVPIKDVVVMLTGDMLDGMGIFSTQESQSEMAPPFQVILAAEVLQGLILALIARKLCVRIYGIKGNHGEIRENGKSKDPNANWDLMLYLILEFWLNTMLKSPLVSIHYSELDYMNFEVNGWKYHIRHIAPQQSETAAGKAKFLGWARKHNFDALAYGHYHHWGIWDRSGIYVFRGGSLPGADEFSEKLSEDSAPTQLIWGCSVKRPMTFCYAVDLGGKK